jgi:hypothetical protein
MVKPMPFSLANDSLPVFPGKAGLIESNSIGQVALVNSERDYVQYYSVTKTQWKLIGEHTFSSSYIQDLALSNSGKAYVLDRNSRSIYSAKFP